MIIGKCRGVTINFLRSDKDYGHNLSTPPPHGDRVKPICILGETILKSCLPISSFHSFFYPSTKFYKTCGQVDKMEKILRKQFQAHLFCHVKVWTLGKKLPFYFMFSLCLSKNWQKVWTGGQVMKIMKKIFLTSCIFLFASVDMWTKRCFSISYFLSVMYSSQFWQKSVDRWTNNENYEKKNFNLFYLIPWKCKLVDK